MTYSVTWDGGSYAGLPTNAGTYTLSGVFAEYADGASKTVWLADTVECTITIAQKQLADGMFTVTGSYTYNGEAQNATYTYKDSATNLTTNDFTVSYENNTNAGTATVTFTGKGNYAGEVTKQWSIAKATLTDTSQGWSGMYDGGAHSITVSASGFISGQNLSNAAGVQIRYGTSSGTYNLKQEDHDQQGNAYGERLQVCVALRSDLQRHEQGGCRHVLRGGQDGLRRCHGQVFVELGQVSGGNAPERRHLLCVYRRCGGRELQRGKQSAPYQLELCHYEGDAYG